MSVTTCAASPPGTVLPGPRIMILALALALLAGMAGVPLASPVATAVACVALLVFGLPHGTLDLELIREGLSRTAGGDVPGTVTSSQSGNIRK